MATARSQFAVKLLPSLADFAFLMPIAFLFGRLGGAQALLGDDDGQIAATDLGNVFITGIAEPFDLGWAEANDDLPFQQANGCRDDTLAANGFFHCLRGLDIGGIGQTMRNDRRFQCDDWPPIVEGDLHLFGDSKIS